MANQSLGMRILSAFLALVIVLGACPIQAFAAETNTDAREDQGVRLPFTEVEDVDADVLHDATKVKQPEEEDPYAPTDVVRVSIVLNKKATLEVYAAAAQLSLNYNIDNLANAGLSEADKALPENIDVSAYKSSITGSEEGIRARSATLMMEEMVRVRVYFDVDEGYDINDYSFTINGQSAEIQHNSKGYFLETDGIAAKDLDTMFTFQVGGISVSYGPMSFVNSKLNSNNPLTVNLVKAIYGYYIAAKDLLG